MGHLNSSRGAPSSPCWSSSVIILCCSILNVSSCDGVRRVLFCCVMWLSCSPAAMAASTSNKPSRDGSEMSVSRRWCRNVSIAAVSPPPLSSSWSRAICSSGERSALHVAAKGLSSSSMSIWSTRTTPCAASSSLVNVSTSSAPKRDRHTSSTTPSSSRVYLPILRPRPSASSRSRWWPARHSPGSRSPTEHRRECPALPGS
mmetsp:Transcript_39799/g.99582  ORF Transcript_39799/g.99582 Transcript_39799/m.99582 type:complete len:202 (-) Transcript_39799:532-1137(-)